MDRLVFLVLCVGLISPCHQFIVDEPTGCQSCTELEQRLVDSLDKIKLLQEENALLKQLSTCHCRDGWIHSNGSCYYMPYQQLSWDDSRQFCQQLGAHLACITSAEEDAIVATLINSAIHSSAYDDLRYVWIGATDRLTEGHWHWVTGEPFVYTNWRVSHFQDVEDCLDYSGGWNDNSCNHTNYFLCEM